MPTIDEIRAGLQTRLRTIQGLNVPKRVPDTVDPDTAVVRYAGTNFDTTMSRGSDDHTYIVQILTSKASDRGQDALYSYLDGEGAKSVKVAIEADDTLGGLVEFAVVAEAREPEVAAPGGVDMYSAELVVIVGVAPSVSP
jgi:hypothetical protein